jgi:hypothetical protein
MLGAHDGLFQTRDEYSARKIYGVAFSGIHLNVKAEGTNALRSKPTCNAGCVSIICLEVLEIFHLV